MQMDLAVKNERGKMLNWKVEVQERWGGYFDEFLNVSDEGEAVISIIGLRRELR